VLTFLDATGAPPPDTDRPFAFAFALGAPCPGPPLFGRATMIRATACNRASKVASLQYSSCVFGIFFLESRGLA
jgi:hypothetical protein